jgi:hypothetical protein
MNFIYLIKLAIELGVSIQSDQTNIIEPVVGPGFIARVQYDSLYSNILGRWSTVIFI